MAAAKKAVYLLISEDGIQIEKEIAKIGRQYFGSEAVERFIFDASINPINPNDDPIFHAIQELYSPSLISPCRMVILKQVDRIYKRGKNKPPEEEIESPPEKSKKNSKNRIDTLVNYVKHPNIELPFLLTAESDKEIPTLLLKAFDKEAIKHIPRTPPAQIRKAVEKKCSDRKVTLTPEAMNYFMECCGGDAAAAQRELEKLLNWAEEGKTVTLEDCRRLVLSSQDEDIWALSRAVEGKKAEAALQSFHLLIEQGDEPIAVIGRLNALFRSLLLCKALAEEKIPAKEWEKRVGKRGYGLEQTIKISQGFSSKSLRRAISLLRQADADVKGGLSDPWAVTERLILELCRIG